VYARYEACFNTKYWEVEVLREIQHAFDVWTFTEKRRKILDFLMHLSRMPLYGSRPNFLKKRKGKPLPWSALYSNEND